MTNDLIPLIEEYRNLKQQTTELSAQINELDKQMKAVRETYHGLKDQSNNLKTLIDFCIEYNEHPCEVKLKYTVEEMRSKLMYGETIIGGSWTVSLSSPAVIGGSMAITNNGNITIGTPTTNSTSCSVVLPPSWGIAQNTSTSNSP